ncbi:MAG: electron transfer flavoprotein subunit beta/FixA family protein [Sulfolobales archaeon]
MPLNIVVLIKSVPDPKSPISVSPEGRLDLKEVKYVVNPGDKYAVEAALQLRENYGGKVIGLSIGLPGLADVYREVLAMGVDEFIYIIDPSINDYDTLQTSYVISIGLRKIREKYGEVNLILSGVEASDTNSGQVPSQLGELLGIPSIFYVDRILEVKGGSVIAKRIIEDGYMIIEAKMPVVLAIADTSYEPRIPSLRDVISARRKNIVSWSIDEIMKEKLFEASVRLAYVKPVEIKRKRKIISDENIDKALDKFFEELRRDNVSLRG